MMDVWDLKETAKYLYRTEGSIRKLVLRRKIPFRKTSGRLIFIRSEIEKWVETSSGVRLEDLQNE